MSRAVYHTRWLWTWGAIALVGALVYMISMIQSGVVNALPTMGAAAAVAGLMLAAHHGARADEERNRARSQAVRLVK